MPRPAKSRTTRHSWWLLSALLLLLPLCVPAQHAQNRAVLRHLIDTTRTDTVRIKAYSKLVEESLDTSFGMAMQYAYTADSLADKTGWLPGRVLAQTAIGYCYQGIELSDSALSHFHAARQLALRLPDKTYMKKCAFALSRFYAQGNPDSNLHYKQELVHYAQLMTDTMLETYAYNELAGFYSKQRHDYRRAIGFWQQALILLHAKQQLSNEVYVLCNMGEAYLDMGRTDSARRYYTNSLDIARSLPDTGALAFANLKLGEYYHRSGQHADSAGYLTERALHLAADRGDPELLRDIWERLSGIYQDAGRAAPALNAYKQYIVLRDSIAHDARNADDAKKILRDAYAHQLSVVHLQQQALRDTARWQRYLLWGAVAGMLLVGVLAIVYYYALVQNRKRARTIAAQARLLQGQKLAIQESLEEKEMLMKEIHHRVKNNLQVISALLQLQSKRSSEPVVKAALDESQNRMLSIAFIHQNLYQHADLKQVEMGSFLAELVRHLGSVYGQAGQQLTIRKEVSVAALNIDIAIPLGLIINELLTNSYKYAFQGRPAGAIDIRLSPGAQPGTCRLDYRDDGPGLPDGIRAAKSKTLGLTLINDLCRQLDGTAQYSTAPGFNLTLDFPCEPEEAP